VKGLQIKKMSAGRTGFTLVEILLASTIGAFVALVAVGALKAVSVGTEMLDSNIDTAAEVRFAAKTIATDLVNLYRDSDLTNTKFVGAVDVMDDIMVSSLTLYTVSRTKARADQPEADVYEVEYFLVKEEDQSLLMKRVWPNPDKDVQPGGQGEWPEELESVPELAEVTIVSGRPDQKGMTMESFIVNFVRSVGAQMDILEQGEQEQTGDDSDREQ
jgi:prepilin-type N-terminal cleavage/methylation domain-containing protein